MGLRVLIVQHGEKERLPGDPGLTRVGLDQAETTASWLARTETPAAIWSSPMLRALQTAAIIARTFDLDCVTDPRLRERMNWLGGPETIDDFLADWRRASADRDHVPRSGDSSADAATRFLDALADLADITRPAGSAIVVAHGGVTTDVLRTLLGDKGLNSRAPRIIKEGVPCCAITPLECQEDRWSVESIAVTSHLAQQPGHRQA